MPYKYQAPFTLDADSRLSDDVLLVAPVAVRPGAPAGAAVAPRPDGTLSLLAVTAASGAAELAPSAQSASGYSVLPLPGGRDASEIIAFTDAADVLHAFYVSGSVVLHSQSDTGGKGARWSQPDRLTHSTGLSAVTVPLSGDVVVSGISGDGNLVLYTADAGRFSAAVVDIGGELLGGQARLQYTAPDSWVLFAAAGGKLKTWAGSELTVTSGPASVSVASPVTSVHFAYLHSNSAMAVFSDSKNVLYSSVGFSDNPQPIKLSRVTTGEGSLGPDGLIRFYGCDPDGKLWVLRQTGWADDDSPVWAPIFPLDVDATALAVPVKGSGALVVTKADGSIDLLSQPDEATPWSRLAVRSDSAAVPLRTPRYRTRLTLTDANGTPCAGRPITLVPSAPVALEAGGQTTTATPDHPAPLTTDPFGVVEFSQPATGLASVTFTASATGAASVPITPYAYLHDALGGKSSIFTGSATIPPMSKDTLQHATVDGQPLAPGVTDAKAEVAAAGIRQAISVSSGDQDIAGFEIDFRDPRAPRFAVYDTRVALDARLDELAASSVGSVWDDIAQFGEDVWNALKSAAMKAVHWVVDTANKVASITVQIAEGITATLKGLALAGIGEITSMVHSIFAFVEAAAEKVLGWLRDVLHWDSIWRTMDAFYGYLTGGISSIEQWIGQSAVVASGRFFHDLKAQIDAALGQAERYLGDATLDPSTLRPPHGQGDSPPGPPPGSPAQNNWFLGKMLTHLPASQFLDPSQVPDGLLSQIVQAVEDSGLLNDAPRALAWFQHFATRLHGDPKAIAHVRAADALHAARELIDLALDATDLLVHIVLDLAADAVRLAGSFLEKPLSDIPVLSWLWDNVIRPPGSTEEMTLGRLACLALAAPVTLAAIQLHGHGPYDPEALGAEADFDGLVTAQFLVSLVMIVFDVGNDTINGVMAQVDAPISKPVLLWNWLDWVVSAVLQVLFWPDEPFTSWDWSSLTYGEKLARGAWVGCWAPLTVDLIFLIISSGLAWTGAPVTLIMMQVNSALDCVLALTLTGLGTAGAAIMLEDNVEGTTWMDIFEGFVGPLPWAGQPLLLPWVMDATEGQSYSLQVVLDGLGDFDAAVIV